MMRIGKINDKKQIAFLFITFVLLFLSYLINLWHVSGTEFYTFERSPEGLVIGKMSRSQIDGVFAYGGLTGTNRQATELQITPEEYALILGSQHDIYLTEKEVPPIYEVYKSQPGGQSILYSFVQKFVPGNNYLKLKVIRTINAFLTAFCFMLFVGWVYRNYGFISGLITAFLILMSPWINNFGHNLWWSFWNFYVPFLTALLVLEHNQKKTDRYSARQISIFLIVAVFIKCFFSGFEYITTVLLSGLCPIVYYCLLHKKKQLSYFFKTSMLAGISMMLGVLLSMVLLVIQISSLNGSFSEGVSHIISSYTKRSSIPQSENIENTIGVSYSDILSNYLRGNAFDLGFFPDHIHISFWLLILFICFFVLLIPVISKSADKQIKSTNRSLIGVTLFSILCPLSWFIIFKQHASTHPHIDFIVWYIPFLIYGYALIGRGIQIILLRFSKSKY